MTRKEALIAALSCCVGAGVSISIGGVQVAAGMDPTVIVESVRLRRETLMDGRIRWTAESCAVTDPAGAGAGCVDAPACADLAAQMEACGKSAWQDHYLFPDAATPGPDAGPDAGP